MNDPPNSAGRIGYIDEVKRVGYFYKNNLVNADIPNEIIDYVPAEMANFYKLIPVSFENNQLVLVTSSVLNDPPNSAGRIGSLSNYQYFIFG